jgi:hypothetical protein
MTETNYMNLLRIRKIVIAATARDLYIPVTIVVHIIHISGAIEYMLTHICRSIGGLG